MPFLSNEDFSFAQRLEARLNQALHGDREHGGLFRQLLGSGGGDNFHFMRGMIVAYEGVLQDMQTIARQMNNEDNGRMTEQRAMN